MTLQSVPDVVSEFNRIYYESLVWEQTTWLGVPILKSPTDLWMYQEILVEVRPEVIVECGTYRGGSALYLASVCDLLDHGEILTIDVAAAPSVPMHPRIHYVLGSSTEATTISHVREFIGDKTCLVILDSDHSRDHVLNELRAYADLVSPDGYLIVEDTNINGHPVLKDFGPGPMEALQIFLSECTDFESDTRREKFGLTFNPRGYLRRRRPTTSLTLRQSPNTRGWSTWAGNPIAERDAIIADLQAQVRQQTAWAQKAVDDVKTRDEIISQLQQQVHQQTAWAQNATAETVRRDEIIAVQQQQLQEQFSASQELASDLAKRNELIADLQERLSEQTRPASDEP